MKKRQLQQASLEHGQVGVQHEEGVQKEVFGLEAVGVREGHIAVSKQQGQGTWDPTQSQQTHHLSHRAITLGTLEVISPVLCYHYKSTFLALAIPYPKELAGEPWTDKDDDWYSSPPLRSLVLSI